MRKIRRGLNLPITGSPRQTIEEGPKVRSVALVGFDYHGMKPTMAVKVGDKVKTGQQLFSDKKTEGVIYTSPASGTVAAINRGAKRVFQSIVVDIEGDEAVEFTKLDPAKASREEIVDVLVQSGLWTALRTRPYSKVPAPASDAPRAIFVKAIDTNPLAADPGVIIADKAAHFARGIKAVAKLTEGKVYVCHGAASSIPDEARAAPDNVRFESFGGVHPAGNSGTHIHMLDACSSTKIMWTISYQDVIAVGELLATGKLPVDRIISLAGPQVEEPRLIRTRLGANLDELTAGQLKTGESRIISGSVFGGRTSQGAVAYLGRYNNQVSVLAEGNDRPFMHYLRAGFNLFSILPIYISSILGKKEYSFSTTTGGSERAMVPVGSYERVMPLDILPTQLLRALIVGDTDMAQKLGALELDEEDLALCTFVCPGKYEYGPILRDALTQIEVEG